MAMEVGRFADTSAAVRRGMVSSQFRLNARRKVDTHGLPKAACINATKSLSEGRATALFAMHATGFWDSDWTRLMGSFQNKSVASFS